MADIRQNTDFLDDFQRPNEIPVDPPWFTANVGIQSDMNLEGGRLMGTTNPPVGSLAYYADAQWDGADAEMWGISFGDAPTTEGWRFGLVANPGSGTMDGYIVIAQNNVGTDTWDLRKYTDGNFITLTSIPQSVLGSATYVLMRIVPGFGVEVYRSADAGANWTQVFAVGDTTYTTGLFAALGATGNNEGWEAFGGGPEEDFIPQFYRRPQD